MNNQVAQLAGDITKSFGRFMSAIAMGVQSLRMDRDDIAPDAESRAAFRKVGENLDLSATDIRIDMFNFEFDADSALIFQKKLLLMKGEIELMECMLRPIIENKFDKSVDGDNTGR